MTDWNCALTEERLSDYLDGILSPAEAAAFSKHASGCDACGKLVAQVGGLVKQMRGSMRSKTPPQLSEDPGEHAGTAHAERGMATLVRVGSAVVATAIRHGACYRRGDSGDSPLHLRHVPGKAEESGPQPGECFSYRQSSSSSDLRAQRQLVNDLRVVYEIQTRLQPDAQPLLPSRRRRRRNRIRSRLPSIRRRNRRPRRIPVTASRATAPCWRLCSTPIGRKIWARS